MAAMTGQRGLYRDPVRQGVLVMTTFGLVWAIAGITGSISAGGVRAALDTLAVAAAVMVAVASFRFRSRAAAAGGRSRHVSPLAGRVFNLVNLAQTIAITAAVFGLVKAGVPGLLPSAVCLVVGLHFLPLARVFDVPQYWWTGALLILTAVAGIAVFAHGSPVMTVLSVVALPAAAVLWSTSLVVAHRA